MNAPDDDSRYIGMFQTSLCHILLESQQDVRALSKINTSKGPEGHIESDTHADTCTAGENSRILSYSNKVCQISPYHPQYEALLDIPIVQAAVAYTHPETGITYILVMNQALYIKDLPHTVINPNQLRCNGIQVDDCPKHLAPDPDKATHSVYIYDQNIRLPLSMKSIISFYLQDTPLWKKLRIANG
jgi:hypothetical protein